MLTLPIPWPKQKIQKFCQQWRVNELALFGSVLRDDFNKSSDVDILIDFAPNTRWTLLDRAQMQQELADILKRKVDLVRKTTIEKSHNPIRRQNILSTAQTMYKKAANVSE